MKRMAIVLCVIGLISGLSYGESLTFLNHFNDDTSFDINPANGDIALGSGTATKFGTNDPDWATGLLAKGECENKCFYQDEDGQGVTYPTDGNVDTDGETGGITVGFWFKADSATNNGRGQLVKIQSGTVADDYLLIDVGGFGNGAIRARFKDSSSGTVRIIRSGVGAIDETDWNYISVTIDLENEEMSIYVYDSDGDEISLTYYDQNNSALGGNTVALSVGTWDVCTSGSTITVGGDFFSGDTSGIYIEELSIDDSVLASAVIQSRVTDMAVGGNELAVQDDGTDTVLTFLNHFNDNSSFDINTTNDDYAYGLTTATTSGSPGWATGLFSSGSPADGCFYQNADSEGVSYPAELNIKTDGQTGGITVGFWFKTDSATNNGRAQLLEIQSGTQANDYLIVDIGGFGNGVLRASYHDTSSGTLYRIRTAVGNVPEHTWSYVVVRIDLEDEIMSMNVYRYATGEEISCTFYDQSSNTLSDNNLDISVDTWEVFKPGSTIAIGGDWYSGDTTGVYVEELTIESGLVSTSTIQKRVTAMVDGGTEMAASEIGEMQTICFLNHFNDNSSFYTNSVTNDDISLGSGRATTFGTNDPERGTGFFPGSSPGNYCFYQDEDTQGVIYDAERNVHTAGKKGGLTIGLWFKAVTGGVGRAQLLRIQSGTCAYDWLRLDVGGYHDPLNGDDYSDSEGVVRARLLEYTTSGAEIKGLRTGSQAVTETDWNYLVVTIDLDNEEMSMYVYDDTGTQVSCTFYDLNDTSLAANTVDLGFSVNFDGWSVSDPDSTITIGGDLFAGDTTGLYIDEFSIDEAVLSESQIDARVAKMVAGRQLEAPLVLDTWHKFWYMAQNTPQLQDIVAEEALGLGVLYTSTFTTVEDFLNTAQSLGVKLNISLHDIVDDPEEIEDVVQEFNDHPATAGWLIADEPYGHSIPVVDIEAAYAVIKQNSDKPVYITFNRNDLNNDCFEDYKDGYDIILFDKYPFHPEEDEFYDLEEDEDEEDDGEWFPLVNAAAAEAESLGKALVPVMQAFGDGSSSATDWRLPTYDEARVQLFYAILGIDNAKDVIFFSLNSMFASDEMVGEPYEEDGETWLDDVGVPVIEELETYALALGNGVIEGAISESETDILAEIFKDPVTGKYYVLTMNASSFTVSNVTFTINLMPGNWDDLTPYGGGGDVSITSNQFTLSYDPFEVKAFELNPNP